MAVFNLTPLRRGFSSCLKIRHDDVSWQQSSTWKPVKAGGRRGKRVEEGASEHYKTSCALWLEASELGEGGEPEGYRGLCNNFGFKLSTWNLVGKGYASVWRGNEALVKKREGF